MNPLRAYTYTRDNKKVTGCILECFYSPNHNGEVCAFLPDVGTKLQVITIERMFIDERSAPDVRERNLRTNDQCDESSN